jgi:hypothetical protein
MAVGAKWTDNGQAFAIDQLDKNTAVAAASFSYFGAWGSGNTTPAVTDNALVSENPEARTSIPAGSMSQPAADTVRWTYTIVATGSRTVQETGIFTASSAGNCHARIVHGSLSLESGDSVAYTVNLRLKDSSEA